MIMLKKSRTKSARLFYKHKNDSRTKIRKKTIVFTALERSVAWEIARKYAASHCFTDFRVLLPLDRVSITNIF